MAKYLLQSRSVDGIWRSPYGSGVRFKPWKTRSKHDTVEAAKAEEAERPPGGLREWRILFRGKTIRAYSCTTRDGATMIPAATPEGAAEAHLLASYRADPAYLQEEIRVDLPDGGSTTIFALIDETDGLQITTSTRPPAGWTTP